MKARISIGLIGEQSDAVIAHRAIPAALALSARELSLDVAHSWISTGDAEAVDCLAEFDGLWCVPGSPYRSMIGALAAIRYARQTPVPFIGTCGGFQHAVIEYAQNVLGWRDAAHAEASPDNPRAVISPLACGILDGGGAVALLPGTHLAAAYGTNEIEEEYFCSFGVNPDFRAALVAGPLREAAIDAVGDLRAVELDAHPFFVATLFQPERRALRGIVAPLVSAYLQACAA